eukprot:1846299-Ditylum_brightwellii.AAC.2
MATILMVTSCWEWYAMTKNVIIPFDAKGTIISFKSLIPSKEELYSLPCIVLTSKEQCDPSYLNLE